MAQRTIKEIIKPSTHHMGPLTYVQPLPVGRLEQIDPFLLLHHHGPVTFPANNEGLPFGPHPHKGFETVTFIFEGDVQHKDSTGYSSTIKAGGIQWMTAGKGIVHSEQSSEEFRTEGGPIELIQLWTNLPGAKKLVPANYKGLQKEDIPVYQSPDSKLEIQAIAGEWLGIPGPINPAVDIALGMVHLKKGGQLHLEIGPDRNILFYQLDGLTEVNGSEVNAHSMPLFDGDGNELDIIAKEDTRILIGHAVPLNEPVVSYGPFVMNTKEEISQAIMEYQSGAFGTVE